MSFLPNSLEKKPRLGFSSTDASTIAVSLTGSIVRASSFFSVAVATGSAEEGSVFANVGIDSVDSSTVSAGTGTVSISGTETGAGLFAPATALSILANSF